MFGEGRVIGFYDGVNCTGTESSLNECQPPYTSSTSLNCGYAGVFCQSKYIRSTYFWFYMMFLLLTVTIDSSERQTTGFPLPTSTVNQATSFISTSGIVEQNY